VQRYPPLGGKAVLGEGCLASCDSLRRTLAFWGQKSPRLPNAAAFHPKNYSSIYPYSETQLDPGSGFCIHISLLLKSELKTG
jgi:hypothetical protein